MTDYAAVLSKNYSGTLWILNGDEYSGLEWLDKTPKPTQSELDAQWPQVAYDQKVALIKTRREAQYKAQSDGLFFEWQRGSSTKQAWEAAVQQIKDANPYPEEI